MKNITLLLLAFFWNSMVFAQFQGESQKFYSEIVKNPIQENENILAKYKNFDFGLLLLNNGHTPLGFIGNDYERLNIKFLTVVKNGEDPNRYYVYGKSRVKSNICQFMGEIELITIIKNSDYLQQKLIEEAKIQNDSEVIDRFSRERYSIVAKYKFYEDPNQKATGFINGILRSNFYIDGEKVFYDDLNLESDGYSNNQYVGTWTSYLTGVTKRCLWGDYRIPYSGDLDRGEGEFSPDPNYFNKGWESYYKAYVFGESSARKEENQVWW